MNGRIGASRSSVPTLFEPPSRDSGIRLLQVICFSGAVLGSDFRDTSGDTLRRDVPRAEMLISATRAAFNAFDFTSLQRLP